MKGIPENVEIPAIRPMNGQVLVYLEPEADKFSGAPSIVKPDSVKVDHVYRMARVVMVGKGAWNKAKTHRMPIQSTVGSRILFVKWIATHTKTGEAVQHSLGKDFALLKDTDILMEVDEDVKIEDISQ